MANKHGKPVNDAARLWANSIAELAISRAMYLDSPGVTPPKLQVGEVATTIYNAIAKKTPGGGKKSLMFTPEIKARFPSLSDTQINQTLKQLCDDCHIVPVHYLAADGETYVGYRLAARQLVVPQSFETAIIGYIQTAGVGGITYHQLYSKFDDREMFTSAIDRLVSANRVVEHLEGDGSAGVRYTAVARIRK